LGIIHAINKLLDPIRKKFATPQLMELVKLAYPSDKEEMRQTVVAEQSNKYTDNKDMNSDSEDASGSKAAKSVADISHLDIRVGRVVRATLLPPKVPNTNSVVMELEIDISEQQPRMATAAIGKVYNVDQLKDQLVCVVVNIKASKGTSAVVLFAANKERSKIELVLAPFGSKAGERVQCPGYSTESLPGKANEKMTKDLLGNLSTNNNCYACWKDIPLVTKTGPAKVASMADTPITK